jgi:hypothetical protein
MACTPAGVSKYQVHNIITCLQFTSLDVIRSQHHLKLSKVNVPYLVRNRQHGLIFYRNPSIKIHHLPACNNDRVGSIILFFILLPLHAFCLGTDMISHADIPVHTCSASHDITSHPPSCRLQLTDSLSHFPLSLSLESNPENSTHTSANSQSPSIEESNSLLVDHKKVSLFMYARVNKQWVLID